MRFPPLNIFWMLPEKLQDQAVHRRNVLSAVFFHEEHGASREAAITMASIKWRVSRRAIQRWIKSAGCQEDLFSALSPHHTPSIGRLVFECFRRLPRQARIKAFRYLARVHGQELRIALDQIGWSEPPASTGTDVGVPPPPIPSKSRSSK